MPRGSGPKYKMSVTLWLISGVPRQTNEAAPADRRGAARMASDLRHAPVDNQFGTVDEAAVIRGEKHDGLGDFIRFARAPQGDRGRHVGRESLDLLLGHATRLVSRGYNNARADRIDADLAVLQIGGPAAGQVAQCGL